MTFIFLNFIVIFTDLHRPEIKATNTSTETTLSCSIQGLPTPNITWFQGGTKVSNGSTLVISNAIFDKVIATTYCEVENSVGKLSSQKFSKMTCKCSTKQQ